MAREFPQEAANAGFEVVGEIVVIRSERLKIWTNTGPNCKPQMVGTSEREAEGGDTESGAR